MKASWAVLVVVTMSIFHYSLMGFKGYDPSIEYEKLMVTALVFTFAWWACEDASKQDYHRPYEFGAFIFFAWPVILPAYLVATRGWKGILLFPTFIILYYLPWLTGWVAYYLNTSNQ